MIYIIKVFCQQGFSKFVFAGRFDKPKAICYKIKLMQRSIESAPAPISEKQKILERQISTLKCTSVIGVDRYESVKTATKAQDALNFLALKGLVAEGFPEINYYNDLERLIDLKLLIQNLERDFEDTLADTSIDRSISISPTSKCNANCVHCRTDSKPNGYDLDFTKLEKADPEFFKIFARGHFGIEGNPLLVTGKNADGKKIDLTDYVKLLYEFGIKKFNIYLKTIDEGTIGAYRRLEDFFRSTPDSSLVQWISFNLYSPHIYGKENPLDDLKAEFLPLLNDALKFASEINILSTGSYKYANAHIFKTLKCLCKIMEDEGFYTIRQHYPKIIFKDDIIDKEEQKIRKKHLELSAELFCKRPKDKKSRESLNFALETIFVPGLLEPEGQNITPTYFVHKKTEKIIRLESGNTNNQGRWKRVENKGKINKVDYKIPTSPRLICPAFLTKQLYIDPRGNIFSCAGSYHSAVPLGDISQSWQEIFTNMKARHEKTRELYNRNILGLINGSFNNWECGMER
jgi:hypothetical protein